MVDNMGTKWWQDMKATAYVNNRLSDTSMWLIEELNGRQCFVLCRLIQGKNRVLYESASIDDVGIWLEKYKEQLYATHIQSN
jgi:hypothetical protein